MNSATATLDRTETELAEERPFLGWRPAAREFPTVQGDWSSASVTVRERTEREEGEPALRKPTFELEPVPQATAATPWREAPSQTLSKLLPLEVTPEAKPYLADDLDFINRRVATLCIEQAARMHVSIEKMLVSLKRSWEGDFLEVVLQVFVEANIPQSLALWDAVGSAIERWETWQDAKVRRLLNERFAVFVEPLQIQ